MQKLLSYELHYTRQKKCASCKNNEQKNMGYEIIIVTVPTCVTHWNHLEQNCKCGKRA